MKLRASLVGLALVLSGAAVAQTVGRGAGSFDHFLRVFRAALAPPDFAALAEQTRLPFLLEGEALGREAFIARAPRLFDAGLRRCLARARPRREDDAMVLSCPPYAFYFRRSQEGRYLLEEFSADGEAMR